MYSIIYYNFLNQFKQFYPNSKESINGKSMEHTLTFLKRRWRIELANLEYPRGFKELKVEITKKCGVGGGGGFKGLRV